MTLERGARLGSYEVIEPLGRGGMGEVYRAKDLKLGRRVAIKVLLSELASDDERLRRFEQEARAASALNHPNIVHIYDIDEVEDTHFIVMELVEGTTFRKLLVEAPLSTERTLELGRQIAGGLAKAHEAGIVHRDLKPENLMLTSDGFVKILDFGLAKLVTLPFELTSDMATMAREGTRHGVLLGTVEYMSPEQAAGRTVDHRSDQFSLGLILYEMATGKLAFRRETAAQTLASIIESEPRPMRELNARCPKGLESVVRRCLAKDPEKRFPTTRELVRALESASVEEEGAPPPPIPPLPQHPGPEEVSLGGLGIGGYVEREVREAFSEVERELKEAFGGELYQVQRHGRLTTVPESKLRKRLRRRRYSGAEMVRRKGDEEWTPLYQSQIFKDEVPHRGDPALWAAKRKVREFGKHLCIFTCFGIAFFAVSGEVPIWMAFWGIGLGAHAFGAAPSAFKLLQRRDRTVIDVQAAEPKKVGAPEELLSQGFRDEVARVEELLKKRGGEDMEELLGEVHGIVVRMQNIASVDRDLREQTTEEERKRIQAAIEDCEARLESASTASDRKLYGRQLDVLRSRASAVERALAVIERLKVRQDVAEHQIKQLRLDLSRSEASSASVPELTSRLQDIRHEVDATEDVDEAIAQELLS